MYVRVRGNYGHTTDTWLCTCDWSLYFPALPTPVIRAMYVNVRFRNSQSSSDILQGGQIYTVSFKMCCR